MIDPPPGSPTPPPPLDLRPPRRAFVLAYVSVALAGVLGAVIGAGLVDVLCSGDCTLEVALGAVLGALLAAGGVGVVAVLVLRAMAEWNTHQARRLYEDAQRQAGHALDPQGNQDERAHDERGNDTW